MYCTRAGMDIIIILMIDIKSVPFFCVIWLVCTQYLVICSFSLTLVYNVMSDSVKVLE